MASSVHQLSGTISGDPLPTQELVLNRLDDAVSIIIGAGVYDYQTVFSQLWVFLQQHLDCGCTFVVSEKSNGFIKFLLDRNCRAVVMTPGKELETVLKRSVYAAIVVARPNDKAFVLKDQCDKIGMPTLLLVMRVHVG